MKIWYGCHGTYRRGFDAGVAGFGMSVEEDRDGLSMSRPWVALHAVALCDSWSDGAGIGRLAIGCRVGRGGF
ncbi:MAG: hypothetical protein AAGL66_14775 [Pseudomonadota bacterium]